MNINEINTPATLLDLDILEKNLKRYADAAKAENKQLWPMLKTHKSLELSAMQKEYGATGFLCGTLDEAEAMCGAGYDNLMYAYPVATDCSIKRVVELSKKCNFIVRIDGLDAAQAINAGAAAAGVKVNYTIIIDSGLHRFGVKPEAMADFARAMTRFENLTFVGLSTHAGHVYAARSGDEVPKYVAEEKAAVKASLEAVRSVGLEPEIITSGTTPTFWGAISDEHIGILHPGNYAFHDAIQISTGVAREEDCALYVLASVISHPSEDLYICDAGTKRLGLDQGAHGNSSIVGFGVVMGHPELTVAGLSEEVGKLHVHGSTTLKVGDKIKIIPNHSCSSANLAPAYIGVRKDQVERVIPIDMRDTLSALDIK